LQSAERKEIGDGHSNTRDWAQHREYKPQRAVEAGLLTMFKVEIDRFLISKGIEG